MKHILLLGTGGTIACKHGDSGLTPLLTGDELLSYVPAARSFCEVEAIQVLNIDSTNIHPKHWQLLCQVLEENYDNYDGFVICHGTDTMAYTAAAMSYLVQHSSKPIVITGAQKPIWFDGTDSKRNLTDAFLYACRGCGGVQIVFNGKVILGTRARKTCSKSYHAFSSVNYPDLAVVQDGRLLQYMRCTCYPRPVFYNTLDDRVSLLKLIPGTSSQLIDFMLDRSDGLIIESFGVGGLPGGEQGKMFAELRRWCDSGRLAVFTTQVPHEGCDLAVYEVGRAVGELPGVLEAHDMTPEAVAVKLMWALGQTQNRAEVMRLFETPVEIDII